MNGWELLKWGSVAVGGAAALRIAGRAAYRGALRVYDDLAGRWYEREQRRLSLEHIQVQNKLHDIRPIGPDSAGRYPLLYGTNGILRDPNNLRAFTLQTVRETWPMLEKLDSIARIVLAAGGWPSTGTAQAMIPEGGMVSASHWHPVTLDDLSKRFHHRPSLHNLLLGYTIDEQGQERPVTGDMAAMVHVLVSGGSGYGKSTLLEALAKQLVLAGDCDLCFVDYGVNTFGMLADYALYPIADTPGMAIALFKALIQEGDRRKAMFAQYPQVKDLDAFNQVTGGNLRPVVCFVDESASLFAHDGLKGPVTELCALGRKYGLGCTFGGTDFKATTMPTEARGNCGARCAFHLEPGLSRSILFSVKAADLRDVGRMLAILPGRPMLEVQCPKVERWDDLPKVRGQAIELQPEQESDSLDAVDDPSLPDDERARRLYAAGISKRQIALRVFGGDGGAAWRNMESALEESSSRTVERVELGENGSENAQSSTTTTDLDWCDFCGRSAEMVKAVTFGVCVACGVAVCSECSDGGLCPDCAGEKAS